MNAHLLSWIESPLDDAANRVVNATEAGVPLDELFLALAEDTDDRQIRRVSRALAERLAAGDDLPTAIAASSKILPSAFRRAIAAATNDHQAIALLRGMAIHESSRKRLQRQIMTALFYPALVISLLSLIIVALCITIVPEFREMFLDFDLELPHVTVAAFKISDWAPSVFAGFIIFFLLTTLLNRVRPVGRLVHWLRTGLPFAGQLWNYSAQHDFASMLAEFVAARMPLDDSLRCVSASLHDLNLSRAVRIVARKCEQGAALSHALAESMHFDRTVAGLAAWGEANDALPVALRQAVDHYEQEIDQYVTFLRRIATPVMYVGVLATVMFFIFAMFVPLADMSWAW